MKQSITFPMNISKLAARAISIVVLLVASIPAFAQRVYAPSTVRSYSTARSYCLSSSASSMTFSYNTCRTGSGTRYSTATTVTWYRNTVNSTTGGTAVSTTSSNSGTSSSKSHTYRPSTSAVGTYYYYCKITWAGAGTCNTTGELTSPTIAITVLGAPATISGASTVCVGSVLSLSNTTVGGTWSASSTTRVSVGSTTGLVTGRATGSVTISYTTGCSSTATKAITVNPLPVSGTVSGVSAACAGSTISLSTTGTGGSWNSSASSVASVSTSGVVAARSNGVATISYTVTNSCGTIAGTKVVTVNATPASITGSSVLCSGTDYTFTNTTLHGSWSSSNTAVASVNIVSGVVTGRANGSTTISYATGCGTAVTKSLTISNAPITGANFVCRGSSITLSNLIAGGSWSSSNRSVASVSTTGIVSGLVAGTATISYTSGSCVAVSNISVNEAPSAISGVSSLCEGATATLTNTANFGIWSSSNANVTIDGVTGQINGVTAGTSIIRYSTGCGSGVSTSVTVVAQPAGIIGLDEICEAATTTLANSVRGGNWTTSDARVASVSTAGIVTGVASGVASITYSIGRCFADTTITINPLPNAGIITGRSTICEGDTTLLASTTPGGVWSTFDTTIAELDENGLLLSDTAGVVTITYSVSNGCGDTTAAYRVNMLSLPAVDDITGTNTMYVGGSVSLSNASSGGVWSSANTSVATVSASGTVYGVSAGAALISYNLTTTCGNDFDTMTVRVFAPTPILGVTSVCAGSSTTLSNSITGGTWSSSNANVAIDATSGIATGTTAGTATISYAAPLGWSVTSVITVNATPAAITGNASLCVGAVATLSNTTVGGTWSSSNSFVTIGSTGIIAGVTSGTALITYMLPTGCFNKKEVNALGLPSSIGGVSTICAGSSLTLTNAATGGTWVSGLPSVATINNTTGVMTAVAGGTATITYTATTGCATSTTVSILENAPLTGGTHACLGSSITLGGSAGGRWNSSNTSVARLHPVTGDLTALSAGSTTISYSLSNGCSRSTRFTVSTDAAPISGPSMVCYGETITLSNAGAGGRWSSRYPSIAAIDSITGVVSGVAGSGAAVSITYTLPSGCEATTAVSVSYYSPVITGTTMVCQGSTTTLGNAIWYGRWSTSCTSARVHATSGVVTGISAGTGTITYTGYSGCVATQVVSVTPNANISGPTNICEGNRVTLSGGTPGGRWSSQYPSIACVDSITGVVHGVSGSGAMVILTYTLPTGCTDTSLTQVINYSSAITGSRTVCQGANVTLGNAVSGGTWSTSSTAFTVGASSGVVTGVAAGTGTVTYSFGSGCFTTTTLEVYPIALISGATTVCEGLSTSLNGYTAGGVWSISDATYATINRSTGVVSGNTGSSTSQVVTYTLPTGCTDTAMMQVQQYSATISGPASFCGGNTITFTNAVSGGRWSTSTSSITIDAATGIATGITSGPATISYTVGAACTATKNVTVGLSALISGTTVLCGSSRVTLSAGNAGGTWASSTPSVASVVASTGVVTPGATTATAIITYTLPSGCTDTALISVVVMPAITTTTTSLCIGQSVTLSNTFAGGAWTSADTTIASISSTGVVTPLTAGRSTISYTLPIGCFRTQSVLVNPTPAAITGISAICLGQTFTLSNSVPGGRWSSSTTVVVIGTSSGVVNASATLTGAPVISYTMPGGCFSTYSLPVVNLAAITGGSSTLCTGRPITFYNSTRGGEWSSSVPSVATIGTSGSLVGLSIGTSVISYAVNTGCARSTTVTVRNAPGVTTGASSVCTGTTITLSNPTTGGTWSSASASFATVGSATGIVTGILGSSVPVKILYTLPGGCQDTASVTVNTIATITGAASICQSMTTTLGASARGGRWTSSNDSVANIDIATGIVRGIVAGTAIISYEVGTGCTATKSVAVRSFAEITGPSSVCIGDVVTMSSAITGGTWSSYYPTIATIGSSSGIVTPISGSGAMNIITYTLPGGCQDTALLGVHYRAPITGLTNVCTGASINLSNRYASAGGTWSSSDASAATVGAYSALVTGVTAGTATISYTMPTGCVSEYTVTVIAGPAAISGPATVCRGTTATLTSATPGGSWSTATFTTASIDATTGVVTGLAASSTIPIMTYTMPGTGCKDTAIIRVTYCGREEGATADETENKIEAPTTIQVIPNPSTGAFALTGRFSVSEDTEMMIDVTNMMGQVIYTSKAIAKAGILQEHINLDANIANGMYLLTVRAGAEVKVMHVVISK